jgi:NAD(P)-dependent dehydrogenase (short-subunit alcohol dehydrogenase family)
MSLTAEADVYATVLITGVSPNGLGEALALALATQNPALLILASRTKSKLHAVATEIFASSPDVNLKEIIVDLSSLNSVRGAAAEIAGTVGKNGTIDVLFNNAGINISEHRSTEKGVEMQFATNHLGPFLLTNLLLPVILRGGDAKRIVNTSSEAHRISPVRFSDINQEPGKVVEQEDMPRRGLPKGVLRGKEGGYEPAIAYGQSKTANVLFAIGLNERLARKRLKCLAVMPGGKFDDSPKSRILKRIRAFTKANVLI